MNAVARMLIDDFDGQAMRALLNTAVTQIGLNMDGELGVVLVDRDFESS